MSARKTIWFQPPKLPAQGAAAIRLLFALLVWFTVPGAIGLTAQPHPVGLAHLFDLTWLSTSAGPGCGGSISAPYGVVTSPGYPGNHSTPSDCTWTLSVAQGHRIALDYKRKIIPAF